MPFPPVPREVKAIAHFLKLADEHENRNIVISYWGKLFLVFRYPLLNYIYNFILARMYACTLSMKMLPGKKPPEVANLLIALMDWLEATKKANQGNEGITNELVAQSLIEEYAMQLFTYADAQDRAEQFNK